MGLKPAPRLLERSLLDLTRREDLFGMLHDLDAGVAPVRMPRLESARELAFLSSSLADYIRRSDEAESAASLCEEFSWLTNIIEGLTGRQEHGIEEIRQIALEAEETTHPIALSDLVVRARFLVDAACRIQERKCEHLRRAWSTDMGGDG